MTMSVLSHYRKQELLKMVVITLSIFALVLFPLTINFVTSFPPYTVNNTSLSGYSIFYSKLQERGYETTRSLLSLDEIVNFPQNSTLIIAGGSRTYSNSELELIHAFVLIGGNLIVLGDNTKALDVAEKFEVFASVPRILESDSASYYKAPNILILKPIISYPSITDLAIISPKALFIDPDIHGSPLITLDTNSSAFLDLNYNNALDFPIERLDAHTVGVVLRMGYGTLTVVSSPSFLTNDLYLSGFDNINLTLAFLDVLTENTDKFICFDENHKNWPIWSNEGVISKLYGTIVHLAKSELFILIIFAIIVSLFYITPRFQQLIRSKESYQSFMEKHIWSRGRELYDTFGLPIKPTVEEQMLVSLYFQYELYPSEVYNLFLQQKLSSISLKNFKADEIEVFHEILKRKMDYKTFMFMFKELEKIEERRNIYANS